MKTTGNCVVRGLVGHQYQFIGSMRLLVLAGLATVCLLPTAHAQLGNWTQGNTGDYLDSTNWQSGTLPGTSGTARILGSSTVYFSATDATSTGKVALNDTATSSSTTSFIQTGGYFNIVGSGLQLGNTGSAPNTAAQYIINAGTLTTTSITFGTGTASAFIVNGGTVGVSGNINVTTGTLAMSSGSMTASGTVIVATGSGYSGALIMSGNSYLSTSSRLYLGSNYGAFTGTLSGSAYLAASNYFIIGGGSSSASLILTGSSSLNKLTTSSTMIFGDSGAVVNVTATDNAAINSANGLIIGKDGSQTTVTMAGNSTATVTSGELDIASVNTNAATGTLILKDYANVSVSAGNVSIGNSGGSATLNMSGSSQLTISSAKGLYVINGNSGTTQAAITLNDYASLNAGGHIGLLQSGTGVAVMTLNNNSSVTVQGGVTLIEGYNVGNSGTAIINLNDNSVLNMTGELMIGQNNRASGSSFAQVNVNDDALLTAKDIAMGGGNGTFGGSVAQLNIVGGTVATGYIRNPYVSGATANKVGINIDNGTLMATANATVATTGTGFFTWTSYGGAPYVNIKSGGMTFDTQSYNVEFNAYLHTDGTSTGGGFTKKGSGSLTLNAGGNYTGTTSVQGGTLLITTAALTGQGAVSLSAGTTLSVSGLVETFNTLSVLGNATLDFGTGSTTISFTDSSLIGWDGTLTLTNFIVGTSELQFGIDSSGLTSAQLEDIYLAGYGSAYLDDNGFLQFSVVPEPSTWGLLIAGIVILGFCQHRRRNTTN